MSDQVEIISVDATNVDELGFFCYKSKPKSAGYQHKLNWLKQRFPEGLRLEILYEGNRSVGYIEYIPGEYAWRAVKAEGYMLIHCPWVVGKGKGNMPDAVKGDLEAAQERGIRARTVKLESSQQVQESAPSAYGVFSVVYDGQLVSYHYLGKKEKTRLFELVDAGGTPDAGSS